MSITHISQKYKRILPFILIISSSLFYICSIFFIGYIEGLNTNKKDNIKVLVKNEERQIKYNHNKKRGEVVASKSGKKYYFPWCSGINRIKDENKVYFSTELDAQNKGLTLSSSCF